MPPIVNPHRRDARGGEEGPPPVQVSLGGPRPTIALVERQLHGGARRVDIGRPARLDMLGVQGPELFEQRGRQVVRPGRGAGLRYAEVETTAMSLRAVTGVPI